MEQYNYVTKLDVKFEHLEKIDVPQLVKECTDKWFNQLCGYQHNLPYAEKSVM